MADANTDGRRPPSDDARLAKALAIGLPLVTVTIAAVVAMLLGPATSILVIAAGLLLGVISLFWGSLRILTGDAALSPELEALEMSVQGVDALSARKKMLFRSLKDLDNEHSLGKLEDDDYEQLSLTHRQELKSVLQRMDDVLAPHRSRADDAVRAHFAKVGIAPPAGYRDGVPEAETSSTTEPSPKDSPRTRARNDEKVAGRLACPKCEASNEPDAKFCKECATPLSAAEKVDEA